MPALLCPPAALGASPSTAPATTQPVNHTLADLSLEDLMNVEVTSVSKKVQTISEAPAAISVISQDDIARSGFSTIPDLLQLAPGVNVGRINSYTWGIGVRGVTDEFTPNLLVVQDGRSLYSPFNGGVYWDTVDYVLQDLDRIEVIRGPGATLWGANAVNGVVNITTKDSRDTQGWLFSTRGSNEDSDLALRYGGVLSDDTTYRVYFKERYFNDFDEPNGSSAGDDWYSQSGGFRIDKHPSENDTVTVQGDYINNQIREPIDLPSQTSPFVEETTSGRYDTDGNSLVRWDHRGNDDSDFSLQAYYDYLKVDYSGLDYDQNTFDVDFHDRFHVGKQNEVTWGAGYRFMNTDVAAGPFLSAIPSTRNLNLYSFFAQDTFTLQPDRWFITAGSKFEHNDFTGYEEEPSARLLWTPDKENSVWAAVSRADRTPSIVESDSRIPAAYEMIPNGAGGSALAETELIGNSDQSEVLTSYELGYRVEPAKTISVDTALFYNDYDNLASLDAGAPISGSPIIIPLYFGSKIDGHTYGGEISSTLRLTDWWRLAGSYSLLDTTFSSESSTIFNSIDYGGSEPSHQAQFHSYLDIGKNVQFNSSVFYVGRIGEFDIPGYVTTDMNVVWQPTESMSLSVGVFNLFDARHLDFGASHGQGIASETPRTVYAQLSYKF
jgi:iron complex outermembrane recepter protein